MTNNTLGSYDFAREVKILGLTQPWGEPFWQGWDHQLVGRAFVKAKKRCIAAIDKGLGKTSWVLSIFEDPTINQGKEGYTVIIFTNEKGMARYREDIELFPDHAEKLQLIYGRQPHERYKRWRSNPNARYFVVTYDSFLSDCGYRNGKGARSKSEIIVPKWAVDGTSVDAVVCDEFHRKFRRHKSATFQMMKDLFRYTEYFICMTGSATNKGPHDLWAALHLCDRKTWSSYWKYVYTWCEVEDHWAGGKNIKGPKASAMKQWQAIMRHWVFRVRQEDVLDMPPKTRTFLEVDLPPWQRKLHNDLLNKGIVALDDGDFIILRNTLEKNHNARLALICPKALDQSYGVGQGIEDIADDAEESGASQYAVFTPFRKPLPFLAEYLRSRGCSVWVLQGGIGLDLQEQCLRDWKLSLARATPDKPSVILSTVKYAESWQIPEARYGYFLGEEYVNEDNKQAEDRLHRLISVGTTSIQYTKFKGTIQEDVITILLDNARNDATMHKNWSNIRHRDMIQQPK